MFWFSLQILSETFFVLRTIKRYIIISGHKFACKVNVILARFWWNFNFLDICSKITQTNFYETPSSRKWVVPCGRTERQTDRHDEANSRFSLFFERAYNDTSFEWHQIDSKSNQIFVESCQLAQMFNLLKTKSNLLYITNQSVPRCEHFPLRL